MPMDFTDPMTVFGSWWCGRVGRRVAMLNCLICKHYKCSQITQDVEKAFLDSPFTEIAKGSELKPRRVKMFLFLMYDDSIKQAYQGFDLDNPDWEQLRDVKEVLQVSKAFTKQMKLVVKPKEERAVIREGINAARQQQPPVVEEPKRGRKKK